MPMETFQVRLESPDFPCENIQVSEVIGEEKIGQLFWFDVTLVNHDASIDLKTIVGSAIALAFLVDGEAVRVVYGMISQATDLLDSETDFTTYRIRIVPRAHRLTLVKTQNVSLDVSLVQVLSEKLDLVGLAKAYDFRFSAGLEKRYPTREYIVQYQETDLAFISRLVEHAGISFFFDHSSGEDRIVFTDFNEGFPGPEGTDRIPFRSRGEKRDVYRLEVTSRVIPSVFAVNDYNYEKPLVDLSASTTLDTGYGGGVVEYGLNYREPEEGQTFARVRAEELEVGRTVFEGESDRPTLAAGVRFVLAEHPRLPEPAFLITETRHHVKQVAGGGGSSTGYTYSNVFRAISAATTFRPSRVTPRPFIHGIMSGIVEAAPGVETERPWIDDKGRYLVRVLFDTNAPGERKASLPIRMAQAHSGPNYGIHFPLRPGVEVLLAFIGGDPDRPVIVGSVPNAVTPNPVVDKQNLYHRIKTSSGVLLEIDDGS